MLLMVVDKKRPLGKMISREISLSEVEGIFERMTKSANNTIFVVTQFR